ncbi:SRPBCC family protein, partial [Rhodopseudomonas sp. WA056]|nr:SRPBCC family protein [Rhodopseudomonas sp. WA056]
PVVVHYTFEAVAGGTRFTRILRNPARPKPPTPEMVERMSAEAELGLGNIKRNVERR